MRGAVTGLVAARPSGLDTSVAPQAAVAGSELDRSFGLAAASSVDVFGLLPRPSQQIVHCILLRRRPPLQEGIWTAALVW